MPLKLILTGHYAGKTVKINGYNFVNGVCVIHGQMKDFDFLIRYFETFGAYPEGHPKLKGANNGSGNHQESSGAAGNSGVRDNQSGPAQVSTGSGHAQQDIAAGQGSVPTGDGASSGSVAPVAPADEKMKKLAKALRSLDPETVEHWTDQGKPRISTLAEATSMAEITRADVEAAIPGWNREVARAEQLKNI